MSFWIEAIGAVAGVITTLCWVPQAWHILKTRETAGVSLATYLALGTGNAFWLLYGALIGSAPIVGANVVTLALVVAIVGLKLRYGSGPAARE